MHPLSQKQDKILRFIVNFARKNGFQPTFREIGAAFEGIKSSTVAYYINVLRKKGFLGRGSSKARALELASPATIRGLTGVRIRAYPILGRVPAGRPGRRGPRGSPKAYLLRISGDSMIGAGIRDGDLVIVQPQSTARSAEIVVATTPNREWTVKRLRRIRQVYRLEAENPRFASIRQPFKIVGRVMGLFRPVN
jgi:repressor LexA